jgi:hypothetical protein
MQWLEVLDVIGPQFFKGADGNFISAYIVRHG